MRKFFLVLIAMIVTSTAWATKPDSIDLAYDPASKVLSVTADHTSNKLNKHFIRNMKISVDGVALAPVYFTRQQTPSAFNATVSVDANPKQTIKVELSCSLGGSIEGEYIVPEPPTEVKPQP